MQKSALCGLRNKSLPRKQVIENKFNQVAKLIGHDFTDKDLNLIKQIKNYSHW